MSTVCESRPLLHTEHDDYWQQVGRHLDWMIEANAVGEKVGRYERRARSYGGPQLLNAWTAEAQDAVDLAMIRAGERWRVVGHDDEQRLVVPTGAVLPSWSTPVVRGDWGNEAGYIYVVSAGDPKETRLFKVGYSETVLERVKAISVASPFPCRLEIFYGFRDRAIARFAESLFHRAAKNGLFSDVENTNGEWYQVAPLRDTWRLKMSDITRPLESMFVLVTAICESVGVSSASQLKELRARDNRGLVAIPAMGSFATAGVAS